MFMGLTADPRAHAILMCRLLAEGAEDANVPLQAIGEIARQLAEQLLEDHKSETPADSSPDLRVIKGGRD